ncbi:MAG: DUF697 domain-containing protein [Kiritimatiellae bacterium]|nr:DUF697 domain-containing protein [Kiritimatiellia bacterium]
MLYGLLSCAVLLWIISSAVSAVQKTLTLPAGTGYAILAIEALLLIGCIVFAIALFRRLFKTVIRFDQIAEPEDAAGRAETRDRLLNRYVLKMPPSETYVAQFPEEGGLRESVKESLRVLTGTEPELPPDGWLAEFKKFQGLQDRLAKQRIRAYAKWVAIKTAVSPWKIVDMIAVFYNSSRMVYDLALIYNKSITRVRAARLVFAWFVNLYIAGQIGDITESAAETGMDFMTELGLTNLASKIAGKFIGKFAEGGLNAFLIYRLGHMAMREFHALSVAVDTRRSKQFLIGPVRNLITKH